MHFSRTLTKNRPGPLARTALAAFLVYGTLGVATARAACGPDASQLPQATPAQDGVLVPVTYQLVPTAGPGGEDNAIVGMWAVQFIAEPGDVVIDHALAQWHSDGTEIMNSSREPLTGSFCLGVWKKTGKSYHLNHYAMSWDATGMTFLGITNIREDVTVHDHGNTYSGTFTFEQFDPDGNDLGPVAAGNIVAQRLMP